MPATSNPITSAWPTAAAWLQGARLAPVPSSAGAPAPPPDSPMSRYQATFRAKLKACQVQARLAGKSTNPKHLIAEVNARMRSMNEGRTARSDSMILNSWNEGRKREKPPSVRLGGTTRKASVRLDGTTRKRNGRARRNGGAAKPSSAGAPGAAAAPADAPADTSTATATATVTPAVTFAGAPSSADTFALSSILESPAPPSAVSEPASEPSPAGSELCLSALLV